MCVLVGEAAGVSVDVVLRVLVRVAVPDRVCVIVAALVLVAAGL